MRTIRSAFCLVFLLAAGCTDELLNGGNGSGGDFAISVSSGVQPTYSWSSGPALSDSAIAEAAAT